MENCVNYGVAQSANQKRCTRLVYFFIVLANLFGLKSVITIRMRIFMFHDPYAVAEKRKVDECLAATPSKMYT